MCLKGRNNLGQLSIRLPSSVIDTSFMVLSHVYSKRIVYFINVENSHLCNIICDLGLLIITMLLIDATSFIVK